MDKLITLTISDGEQEYTTDFIMENVNDFDNVVNNIVNDLDICY